MSKLENATQIDASTKLETIAPNVLLPEVEARFDDAQPRVLMNDKNKTHHGTVWLIENDLNQKIPGTSYFLIKLRQDGLGLTAQPDEETWEMMKHRGGKRLVELAARMACQTYAFNETKDNTSRLVTLQLMPKGARVKNKSAIQEPEYDPSDANQASAMKQMAMTLTKGPVWLPPAPTARVRGWPTAKNQASAKVQDEDE